MGCWLFKLTFLLRFLIFVSFLPLPTPFSFSSTSPSPFFCVLTEPYHFTLDEKLAQESKDIVTFDLQRSLDDYKICTLPRRNNGNRLYQSFNGAIRRPASTVGV